MYRRSGSQQSALPRRVLLACAIGLLCLSATSRGQAQDDVELRELEAIEATWIRSPVTYHKAMLLLVTEQGAAALQFREPFERSNQSGNGIVGASYDWRYLSADAGASEQSGSGRVFAKLVDGQFAHGQLKIEVATAIEVMWNFEDLQSGWLLFDPETVRVHPMSAKHFDGEDPQGRGLPRTRPIDLTSFLPKTQVEEYLGPPSTNPSRLSSPLPYEGSAVVVRDRNHIAVFRLGASFDRSPEDDTRHYGVQYEFQYETIGDTTDEDAPNEQAEHKENGNGKGETPALPLSGSSEVYELYLNGRYSKGSLNMRAGDIALTWSRGGSTSGWIYYSPLHTQVWIIDQRDTQRLVNALKSFASDDATQPGS